MTEILKIIEALPQSQPIFNGSLDYNDTMLSFRSDRPIQSAKDHLIDNDLLTTLIKYEYREHFNKDTGQFDRNNELIAENVMQSIYISFADFIRYKLQIKRLNKSKLYTWLLYRTPRTTEFRDIAVVLYKYLKSHDTLTLEERKPHEDNVVAILQAMQEKYDGK